MSATEEFCRGGRPARAERAVFEVFNGMGYYVVGCGWCDRHFDNVRAERAHGQPGISTTHVVRVPTHRVRKV